MGNGLTIEIEGGICVLTLSNPPGNALTDTLCDGLTAELHQAMQRPEVSGVVLCGAGQGFSAGLNMAAIGDGATLPDIAGMAAFIEAAPKPVVFALHGMVLGAAFELALAAHGRVAHRATMVGLPEISLGLIPVAGATQRLPRLVGAQAALELMLSGRSLSITDHRLSLLTDQIVPDGVRAAAIRQAQALTAAPSLPRLSDQDRGLSDPGGFQTAISEVKAQLKDPSLPEADIVACVEAAQLLPFAQGLVFEAARSQERICGRGSRIIRHHFVARQRAGQLPKALADLAGEVACVAILGRSSGVSAAALTALRCGYHVIIESGGPAQNSALVKQTQRRVSLAHWIDPAAVETVAGRVRACETDAELEEADIIIDLAELTPDPPIELKPGAIWLVTSPTVPAANRGEEVAAVSRTLRMRTPFVMSNLVELSAPSGTAKSAVATAHRAFSRNGQAVVLSVDKPGGLSEMLFAATARASLNCLIAGHAPDQVQKAVQALGYRQGPLLRIDQLGANKSLKLLRQIYEKNRIMVAPLRLLSDRIADKTLANPERPDRVLAFHVSDGQSLTPDPDLQSWLADWRLEYPERSLKWPDVSLETALQAALVNTAAVILQEKRSQRVSDIDLAAEMAFGLRKEAGGPLINADIDGLLPLVRAMHHLKALDAELWDPNPLILDMVKNGQRFFS